MRASSALVQISQCLQLEHGWRCGLVDRLRESHLPPGILAHFVAADAWMQADDFELARLGVRSHQTEVGDDQDRPFGLYPERAALSTGRAMAERRREVERGDEGTRV